MMLKMKLFYIDYIHMMALIGKKKRFLKFLKIDKNMTMLVQLLYMKIKHIKCGI